MDTDWDNFPVGVIEKLHACLSQLLREHVGSTLSQQASKQADKTCPPARSGSILARRPITSVVHFIVLEYISYVVCTYLVYVACADPARPVPPVQASFLSMYRMYVHVCGGGVVVYAVVVGSVYLPKCRDCIDEDVGWIVQEVSNSLSIRTVSES